MDAIFRGGITFKWIKGKIQRPMIRMCHEPKPIINKICDSEI